MRPPGFPAPVRVTVRPFSPEFPIISHVLDQRERDLRHRAYLAAPLLAEQFPAVRELAVRMKFNDPEGKEKPQPSARVFSPDMRAFFQLQCPLRDCTGGGFDLTSAVPVALKGSRPVTRGSFTCEGRRKRHSAGISRCGLAMEFEVVTSSPAPR